PMAFIGGLIVMEASVYKKILGSLLFIPVIRFLFFANVPDHELKKSNVIVSVLIGCFIGFLSGLIGIGGGIILSPILLLLKWTNQKQTAAISALFIFVNSLSGLAGQLTKGINISPDMLSYVAVAFAGGLCGAYLGALRFNQNILKNTLAVVLMMAGWKLIFT
ncbi:MAG: TSUP family transporter, partial [Daejeonella sp.]